MRITTFFALMVGFLVLCWTNALAQAPGQILINYPQAQENEDQTTELGIYFNLLGINGQIDTTVQVEKATLLLEDGSRYEGVVSQPDSPIYVMLVLDASGTMTRAAADMRAAATEAVRNAPDNAQFAVLRFNSNIDLLQGFTDDRDAVIAAIEQVQAVNQSGTCLFDASYLAIEELSKLPAGRRAIVLFTDGQRDEVLGGEPCSTHVFDEVVALANQTNARVPIHTIGLIVRPDTDTTLLRNLASNTGGLSAIGQQANLNDLFQQIMNALSAQWLVQADVCPLAGPHTAQLLVTLDDGSFPQPALTYFTTTRDCILATPTPEPTIPTEVVITVNSIQLDPAAENIALDMGITGIERVQEYRFEFKNADTNLLLGEFRMSAPLPNPVSLPTRSLADGDMLVVITAFDDNSQMISRTQESFTYTGPTPTPPPPTNTPTPIGAIIETVQYDEANNHVLLNLDLASPEQIASLQINVIDAETRLLVNTFQANVHDTITLDFNRLEPGEYSLSVIAENETGQNLSENSVQFVFNPPREEPGSASITSFELSPDLDAVTLAMDLVNEATINSLEIAFINTRSNVLALTETAQAAPEIEINVARLPAGDYQVTVVSLGEDGKQLSRTNSTFTYSPMTSEEAQVTAVISSVESDNDSSAFILSVRAEHADLIERYQVQLRNEANNLLAGRFDYSAPEDGRIVVDLSNIPQGTYTLLLTAYSGDDLLLAESSYEGAVYTPKKPSLLENPLFIGVIGLLALGFGALLFALLRKPKASRESRSSTPMLQQLTINQKINFADEPSPPDQEKTFVMKARQTLPLATLHIEASEDTSLKGRKIIITETPFSIGRNGKQLKVVDHRVSREHVRITFEDGQYIITDLDSANGTFIDGKQVKAQTPTPLHNGAKIHLGASTEIKFISDESGPSNAGGPAPDNQMDKTMYGG